MRDLKSLNPAIAAVAGVFCVAPALLGAAATVPASGSSTPVAVPGCTPTTNLEAPTAAVSDSGLSLPAEWFSAFESAQGALPSDVPAGRTQRVEGTFTLDVTYPGGDRRQLSGPYAAAAPVGDLTGLHWAPSDDATTVLAFAVTRLPAADGVDGAFGEASARALEAAPDASLLAWTTTETKADRFEVPLVYWDGCESATVVIVGEDVSAIGGGGGS